MLRCDLLNFHHGEIGDDCLAQTEDVWDSGLRIAVRVGCPVCGPKGAVRDAFNEGSIHNRMLNRDTV